LVYISLIIAFCRSVCYTAVGVFSPNREFIKLIGFCGSLPCKGGASFFPLQQRKEGCMMVVTWHALYEVATLLVDTGMFICSFITAFVTLRNELRQNNNDSTKKK
jgi:hypothetical protein